MYIDKLLEVDRLLGENCQAPNPHIIAQVQLLRKTVPWPAVPCILRLPAEPRMWHTTCCPKDAQQMPQYLDIWRRVALKNLTPTDFRVLFFEKKLCFEVRCTPVIGSSFKGLISVGPKVEPVGW